LHRLALVTFCAFITFACSPPGHRGEPPNSLFERGVRLGKVDLKLREASGLVASVANPGMLWTHNDSKNSSEIYLIDGTAKIRMTCRLKVKNRDWEDISIGKGPDSSKNYIYLGEIGDNLSNYDVKIIYRFEEPVADEDVKDVEITDTLLIKLEDGNRDTEALMLDPLTNDIIIVSKWETPVIQYRVAYPFEGDTLIGRRVAEINMTEVTAGSISRDGKEVLLRSYNAIHYWRRADNTPIEQLITTEPMLIPYVPEFQGEAITWDVEGKGFYTLSESRKERRAHLIFYKRVE
jgi:hypothetical protein